MSQSKVVLLLGSNLGNPKKNLERAMNFIEQDVNKILQKSYFLYSQPQEFVSNNIFCNIALIIETSISPIQLLKKLKEIEIKLGRYQDSSVYHEYRDRLIDIDIVYYGNIFFVSDKLQIPHVRRLKRDFSIKLLNNVMNK